MSTLRARFIAIGLAALVLIVLSVGFNFSMFANIKNDWHRYQQDVAQRQELLAEIKNQFGYGGLIHNFKNYVLRGTEKYHQRIANNYNELSEQLTQYRAIATVTESERQALKQVENVASQYRQMADEVARMAKNGASAEAIDKIVKISDGPALEGLEQLNSHYHTLKRAETELLETELKTDSYVMLAVGAALVVLIAGSLTWLFGQSVVRVQRLQQVIEKANVSRDLSVRAEVKGSDEVASTSKAFNDLMAATQDAIRMVMDSTNQIVVSVTQLSTLSKETNELMQSQQQETELVTTAMNEMGATVKDVAQNTSNAAEQAQKADDVAANGGQVVAGTIQAIGTLATELERTEQTINELEDGATEIGGILDEIVGIADQTNLLALNAAIEAARAGEQGRGFAVVAEEVRSLAQRTQGSTEKIQEMIDRLQSGANSAVEAMRAGKAQSNASVERAQATDQALAEIMAAIQTINQMNQQIATASEQQSCVVEEMNRNVNTIYQASEETSSNTKEMSASFEQLSGLSKQLEQMVRTFKI